MLPGLRLDPRARLVLFIVVDLLAIRSSALAPNLLFACLIAFLLACEGQRRFALRSLVAFVAVLLLEATLRSSEPEAALVVVMSLAVIVRIMMLVIMAFNYVGRTTDVGEFMAAMQEMRLPMALVIPIATVFRFVPTVREEYEGVMQAMSFRGMRVTWRSVLRHPALTIERILVPLLFSSMTAMDELASAAMARGLDSTRRRTSIADVRMGHIDWAFIAGAVCLYVLARGGFA